MQKFICSCPGKVLLCGGYAILNPDNHGLSLAIDVNFKTTRTFIENKLIFKSTQFNQLIQYPGQSENPYFDAIYQVLEKYKLATHQWLIETNPDEAFYSGQQNTKIKSGLGSSACLIVSCLGQFVEDNDLLFQYAKEANMIAQKNVGSGFDISTAIYGSQLFSKKEIQKCSFTDLQLLMIDMRKGENTVKGVNTIQEYLANDPKYKDYFLKKSEECVLQLYESLQKIDKQKLAKINNEYRQMMRELSGLAKFDIEPAISREIIDYVMTFPSALWGICPGAGGYDAIAILCKDIKQAELDQISQHLSECNLSIYNIGSGISRSCE